ncbi:MAG TPA: hypothetical protein VGT08_19750 [Terracidiphilus sp.]|nr:hypothetical protein [Terracidiphilus sp.]
MLLNLLAHWLVYWNMDDLLDHKQPDLIVENWFMKSKLKIRIAALMVLMVALMTASVLAGAQAASRFLGTVTAVSGTTLTVKTDAGEVHQVDVPATAVLKQVEPGAKDLNTAQTIQFDTLATGDRVLVRLDPNTSAGATVALQIIAVKQADLAKKEQREREDWQQRGVGGLVKGVDSASGVIVLTTGAGTAAKTITIRTSKETVLKRYAPASVRYDLAKTEPIDSIRAGDQLRARGAKNAAGTEMTAEEVVSGSFRNISGTITSIDAASSSLVVKDLTSKKQVTVHVATDTQMRQLPERMATILAAALNGNGGGAGGRNGAVRPQGAPDGGSQAEGGGGQGGAQRAGFGGGGNGFDAQQMLSRAPAIQLADLKKGEAVMVVATEDGSGASAITLMAGVEPLLQAPAASQNLLSWSLSSGAPDVAQ